MTYPFMNIKHIFLHKIIQIILVSNFSHGLIKESFIKTTQYNFAYPDKYVDVIHKPTTTSQEFHITKLKRGEWEGSEPW